MATQRLTPGAILERVNLTGQLSAIQDDPDSPDNSWLTASNVGSDVFLRVSFPTPGGDLTGTQEIRAQVRKTSASNAPTCELFVYQGGVQLASISGPTTISGVTVVSGTFDASLITDPVNIEARINGVAGGGSPSKRASLEVGAIEFNATYQVAVESHSGSTSLSGGGTLVASGTKKALGSVSIAGGGLLSATGVAHRLGTVLMSGGGSIVATASSVTAKAASVVISGGGTLVASGRKAIAAVVNISAGGSVTANGHKGVLATTSVSAGGGLTASGLSGRTGSVSISGGGNVLAIRERVQAVCRGAMALMTGVGR